MTHVYRASVCRIAETLRRAFAHEYLARQSVSYHQVRRETAVKKQERD
jgi:hypothetical protein